MSSQNTRVQQVRAVIDRMVRDGVVVADGDDTPRPIFPIAISADEGEAVRSWVMREQAVRTVEVGLAYGLSALHICEGLVANGDPAARHVVIDPFQRSSFADCGLRVLAEAGVGAMIEHHAAKSQIVLPRLLDEGREFDLAFVDGNHRFDAVFLDLSYLGLMVRRGGIIVLDDYDLPAIQKAVAFFVANLSWTVEETGVEWAVVRTAREADERHFTYFVDF